MKRKMKWKEKCGCPPNNVLGTIWFWVSASWRISLGLFLVALLYPPPLPPLLEISTRRAHLQHLSPGGYPCFQMAMALSGDSVLLLGNVTAFPRAVSYNYRDHRAGGEIFSLCFSWTQDSWSKTETATEKEEKHGYSVDNQSFLSHLIFISGKSWVYESACW